MAEATKFRVGGNDIKIKDSVAREQISELNTKTNELSSNLDTLEYGETAGGKNLLRYKFKQYSDYIRTNTPILLKAGKYTISGMTNDDKLFFVLRYVDGKYVDNAVSQNIGTLTSYQFTLSSDMYACFQINATDIDDNYYNNSVMLEKGTTATDYEPYIPSVKMLAEEVGNVNESLVEQKMLGWTVPSECPIQNYVDSNGVFHQIVGRVDLGSLEWEYSSADFFYSSEVENMPIPITGGKSGYCSVYGSFYVASYQMITTQDKIITYSNSSITGKKNVCIRDTSYTDATTFKNAMQGVYLYYELANPITMDITGSTALDKTNDSLSEQGLLDVFNDNWKQGMYDVSTGIWQNNTNVCCSAEPMTCKGGDIVTLEYKGTNNGIYIFFYNGDTFLSQLSSTNGYLRTTVPSNATCFNIEVVNSNITPQTVGHISVYVNNAIENLKNDLTVKPVYIPSSDGFGTVSDNASYVYGKLCVLSFKITAKDNLTKGMPILPDYIRYENASGETIKPLAKTYLTSNGGNEEFYISTNGNIYVGKSVSTGISLYITGTFLLE